MFHEQVQKEIGRRQIMEENRQQRTTAYLRGNIPTTLPEMAAQQRIEQSNEPEFFDISDANEVPTQVMEKEQIPSEPMTVDEEEPPPEPEEPRQTRRRVRVKQGTQPMTVDDEEMEAAQTTGEKRQLEATYENKQTKIRKSKIRNFIGTRLPKTNK